METQNDIGQAASALAPTKSKHGRTRGAGALAPAASTSTADRRGHYLLLRELHTSAKSQVFLAHDSQLDRTVALKWVAPGRRDHVRYAMALRNEARLLANFNHANIVNLFSVEEDADGPFLAMEYLTGRTLAARLHEGGLDAVTAARIFTQILHAVDSIHRHGIVHGDLVPDNLFLLQDGTVKVLDFGSARIDAYADGGNNEPELDNMLYFAPERLHSGVRDISGDLYSVGVVLYQSLCGLLPAHDDGLRTFEQRLGSLSAPLRAVVLRATAADASQRFRSAVEFRNALHDAVTPAIASAPAGAKAETVRTGPAAAILSSLHLGWVRSIRGLHFDIALVSVLLAFLFALGLTPTSPRSAADIGDDVSEPPAASAMVAAKPAPAKKADATKPAPAPAPGDRYRSLRKAWGTE